MFGNDESNPEEMMEKFGGIGEKKSIFGPIGSILRGDWIGYGPLAIQSSLKFPAERKRAFEGVITIKAQR